MTRWNIAHRGGAGLWPENTLPAFADAVARGCDGAELDVQLSADGVVIVHHDFRLHPGYARDADGHWLDGAGPRIKDLALEELRRFDIGRARLGDAYALAHPGQRAIDGTRIPTLAEVIACAKASDTFRLLVELKTSTSEDSGDPIALADAALTVVEVAGFLDRVHFIGFDWRGLARVRQNNPGARLWCDTDSDIPGTDELFGIIRGIGAEGWFPHYSQLTPQSVTLARARGLSLAAWTVNDQTEMRRLIGLGVDAICTDRPDLLQPLE